MHGGRRPVLRTQHFEAGVQSGAPAVREAGLGRLWRELGTGLWAGWCSHWRQWSAASARGGGPPSQQQLRGRLQQPAATLCRLRARPRTWTVRAGHQRHLGTGPDPWPLLERLRAGRLCCCGCPDPQQSQWLKLCAQSPQRPRPWMPSRKTRTGAGVAGVKDACSAGFGASEPRRSARQTGRAALRAVTVAGSVG